MGKTLEKLGQDPYSPKEVKYLHYETLHVGFDVQTWWREENFYRPVVEKDLEDYL